jgi:hypothetical protein
MDDKECSVCGRLFANPLSNETVECFKVLDMHDIGGMKWKPLAMFKQIFHWKYSQVVLPLLFGTGVGAMLSSEFTLAYAFFAFSWVWFSCFWLTHDTVLRAKQRTGKFTRKERRLPAEEFLTLEKKRKFTYRMAQAFPLLLGVVIITGACRFTYQKDRQKQAEATSGLLKPSIRGKATKALLQWGNSGFVEEFDVKNPVYRPLFDQEVKVELTDNTPCCQPLSATKTGRS